MKNKADPVFELLETTLGAVVIEVWNATQTRLLWRRSQLTGCVYESKGIDSERHSEETRK